MREISSLNSPAMAIVDNRQSRSGATLLRQQMEYLIAQAGSDDTEWSTAAAHLAETNYVDSDGQLTSAGKDKIGEHQQRLKVDYGIDITPEQGAKSVLIDVMTSKLSQPNADSSLQQKAQQLQTDLHAELQALKPAPASEQLPGNQVSSDGPALQLQGLLNALGIDRAQLEASTYNNGNGEIPVSLLMEGQTAEAQTDILIMVAGHKVAAQTATAEQAVAEIEPSPPIIEPVKVSKPMRLVPGDLYTIEAGEGGQRRAIALMRNSFNEYRGETYYGSTYHLKLLDAQGNAIPLVPIMDSDASNISSEQLSVYWHGSAHAGGTSYMVEGQPTAHVSDQMPHMDLPVFMVQTETGAERMTLDQIPFASVQISQERNGLYQLPTAADVDEARTALATPQNLTLAQLLKYTAPALKRTDTDLAAAIQAATTPQNLEQILSNAFTGIVTREGAEALAAKQHSFVILNRRGFSGIADFEPLLKQAKNNYNVELFKSMLIDRAPGMQGDLSGLVLDGNGYVDLTLQDLSGLDLSGITLDRVNLKGAKLDNANLENATLTNTLLEGASMKRANLQNAQLRFVDLKGADLSEANLQGVNLFGTNLFGVNLSFANLRGLNLNKWIISNANMQGANLSDANLNGVMLNEVNLEDANLSNANLGVSLSDVNLVGAQLSGANLENLSVSSLRRYINIDEAVLQSNPQLEVVLKDSGINIKRELYLSSIKRELSIRVPGQDFSDLRLGFARVVHVFEKDLSNADLSGMDFDNVSFEGVNLSGANFQGATLRGVSLGKANLQGANLSGANFIGRTNLKEANFQNANLSGANFTGRTNSQETNFQNANLRGVNLAGQRLLESNLSKADLSGANLSGAAIWDSNLQGANLNNVDLSQGKLSNVNLSGAQLTQANLHDVMAGRITIDQSALDTNAQLREILAGVLDTQIVPSGSEAGLTNDTNSSPDLSVSPDSNLDPPIDSQSTQSSLRPDAGSSNNPVAEYSNTFRPFNPNGIIGNDGTQAGHGNNGNNNGAITAVAGDAPDPDQPFQVINGQINVSGIQLPELDLSGNVVQPGESIFGTPVGLPELPTYTPAPRTEEGAADIPVADSGSETTPPIAQQPGGVTWGGDLGNDKGRTAAELGLDPSGKLPGPEKAKMPEPTPGYGEGVNPQDLNQTNTRDWGGGPVTPDQAKLTPEGFPQQDKTLEGILNPEGPAGARFRFPPSTEEIPAAEYQAVVKALPALQQISVGEYSQLSSADQKNILVRAAEYQTLPADIKANTTLLQYADSGQTSASQRGQMLGEQQRQTAQTTQQALSDAQSGLSDSTIQLINTRINALQQNTAAINQQTQVLTQSNANRQNALVAPTTSDPVTAAFIKPDIKPDQTPPASHSAPESQISSQSSPIPRFMVVRTANGPQLMENLPNGKTQMLPYPIPADTPVTRQASNGSWTHVPDAYAIGAKNLLDTLFLQGAVKMLNNGNAVQVPGAENAPTAPTSIPQPAY